MSGLVVLLSTVALIALSAFFVAVEFASLAAKRHRLEDAATSSRSARAALRSSSELTVLLAGAQLGITACTLALGAVTKPAVHHWITPVVEDLGAPLWVADVAGFVLALIIVTFLHLVVGEMAPKSWAIAHPERSAIMLAVPMRGVMWALRPVLRALNESANWCLRRVGVEPAESIATGQSASDLRHLVEHSANVGALDAAFSRQVARALDSEDLVLGDLVRTGRRPTSVPAGARVADVQTAARESGHLRVLVTGTGDQVTGVVHVRDTLVDAPGESLAGHVRPVLSMPADTPVHEALALMRESRNHLVLVTEAGSDRTHGVVTMTDVLARLFPPAQREGVPAPV